MTTNNSPSDKNATADNQSDDHDHNHAEDATADRMTVAELAELRFRMDPLRVYAREETVWSERELRSELRARSVDVDALEQRLRNGEADREDVHALLAW